MRVEVDIKPIGAHRGQALKRKPLLRGAPVVKS